MIDLAKEFIGAGEVKGLFFHQIAQSDKAYLYQVSNEDGLPRLSGWLTWKKGLIPLI